MVCLGIVSVSVSVSVWFGQQNVLSGHIHANLVVEKRKVWIDVLLILLKFVFEGRQRRTLDHCSW